MALLTGRKGYYVGETLIRGLIVSHQLGDDRSIATVEMLDASTGRRERVPASLVKLTEESAVGEIDRTIRYWQDRRAELVDGSI